MGNEQYDPLKPIRDYARMFEGMSPEEARVAQALIAREENAISDRFGDEILYAISPERQRKVREANEVLKEAGLL